MCLSEYTWTQESYGCKIRIKQCLCEFDPLEVFLKFLNEKTTPVDAQGVSLQYPLVQFSNEKDDVFLHEF